MSDSVPTWKKNFEKAQATRKERADARAGLKNAVDKLGAEALWLRLANGSKEDFRCFMQLMAKHLIGEQVQVDTSLTVKIVTQVGEQGIVIDGGREANLKLPPKNIATGERLEVVPDRA